MCFDGGGHFSFFADSLALISEFGVYHTRYNITCRKRHTHHASCFGIAKQKEEEKPPKSS